MSDEADDINAPQVSGPALTFHKVNEELFFIIRIIVQEFSCYLRIRFEYLRHGDGKVLIDVIIVLFISIVCFY